jgi:cytoskeletal protein RodZ
VDIGAALRQARQQRAMSLDDVARATKIRVAILSAIETNRRDEVPEGIYLRGFVRAYAREVGLNPDDTVSRYLGQFEPIVNVVQSASTSGPAESQLEQGTSADWTGRDVRPAVRSQWLVAMIVLVVGLAGYNLARWRSLPPSPSSETSQLDGATEIASSSSTSRTSTRPETGTAGSPESTATAFESVVLHLDLRAGSTCWVSATADGTRVVYRLMQAGEQQVLDVHRDAVLRVGDAGAFVFSINGMTGRALGRAGEPVTAHITSENYREYLQR